MSVFSWIVLACLLSGVLSVFVAAVVLVLPAALRAHLVPHLVSFATGSLLGAAFLALLPHALDSASGGSTHVVLATVLGGVLMFFLLEKLVLWRHCHVEQCEAHPLGQHERQNGGEDTSGILIVIGDSVHNFIDGILIAAAFLTDIHLGVVTAIAVAAHEIPQEVGEFAVLLHSGFRRRTAFFFNVFSSLTAVLGGIVAYFAFAGIMNVLPFVLAVAAASFIYIAIGDLIPGLHKRPQLSATLQQSVLIGAGILVIGLGHSTLH